MFLQRIICSQLILSFVLMALATFTFMLLDTGELLTGDSSICCGLEMVYTIPATIQKKATVIKTAAFLRLCICSMMFFIKISFKTGTSFGFLVGSPIRTTSDKMSSFNNQAKLLFCIIEYRSALQKKSSPKNNHYLKIAAFRALIFYPRNHNILWNIRKSTNSVFLYFLHFFKALISVYSLSFSVLYENRRCKDRHQPRSTRLCRDDFSRSHRRYIIG